MGGGRGATLQMPRGRSTLPCYLRLRLFPASGRGDRVRVARRLHPDEPYSDRRRRVLAGLCLRASPGFVRARRPRVSANLPWRSTAAARYAAFASALVANEPRLISSPFTVILARHLE